MSSMLEQAIIDAAALRETAMKNAEATLIEKYNKEFQSTVEKLLEQEEVVPPTPEMSQDAAAANGENPTGPTVTDPAIDDPMAGMSAPAVDPTSDVFKSVKSAFFDLGGDDNELITINFDGLTAKPGVDAVAGGGGLNTQDMNNAAPMMENFDLEEEVELDLDEAYDRNGGNERYHETQELEEDSELDEEVELELEQMGVIEDPASANLKATAGNLKAKAAETEAKASRLDASAKAKASKEQEVTSKAAPHLEEEVELTEEELNELEEALRVDVSNQYEGYMGSHKRKERENKAIAYAEARDDKKTEYREKYAKKITDLQETLKKSEEQNSELISAVRVLKEQIEKINVSNAKLLYTNKVLSNVSLNERQKNNIVENITRAETVSEAKTIYETLQSTVQSVTQKTPKSLSEALNRGTSPFLVRKEPASLNDMMADRMKALAGIKRLD